MSDAIIIHGSVQGMKNAVKDDRDWKEQKTGAFKIENYASLYHSAYH